MNASKNTVVGLLGSTGNLGSTFLRKFAEISTLPNISVKSVGRQNKISNHFNVTKDGFIKSSEGAFPDVIVNLSNSYFPSATPEQNVQMEDAILGVAEVISNTIEKSGCSVISASTYFQYCPSELQPWSKYSEIKNTAKEMIEITAKNHQTNFSDFVLYDNFGGINRNKFVDLVEQSLFSGNQMDCTNGEQVLNLTHVDDLVEAFISELVRMSQGEKNGCRSYELKSNFTMNLREIVRKAELASGRYVSVNWGAIPYREREVFELWETGLPSPGNWNPQIDFETYIEGKYPKENKMVIR